MQGQYNMRSPAVKRLMKEAQELREPTELYHAQPLEDNLFEWHFTLRGPEESDFDGGFYHGRIILPPEYPMKPPSIILLTPNGRFETFKKICLSISGHHPESWQPSWSIRTALLAIIGFMPTHGGGAIGSLDYTPEERKVLAKKSQDWKCPECGDLSQKLKPKTEASEKAAQEAKELASQINFQGEKQGASQAKTTEENTTTTTPSDPSAQSTPTTNPSAAPPQPPFSYPWPMPPGWGHPGLASPMTLGSVTVHRFPYPPPMMMPPHSMFSTPSQNGGGGPRLPGYPPVPPFHLGMRFPAMPAAEGAGGGVAGPQTVGAAAPAASLASQPASAPSEATSSPPPAPSVTPSSTPTTATPTSAASPPASPQTTAAAATSPTSSATTTATAVTAAAASSASAPVSDSATTTTTATSSSGATPAPATELRQRSTTTQPHTVGGQQPVSSAPTAQQTQWGYSPSTVVMMVLLSLAITLLLGRRMYMQFMTKDFWGPFQ